LHTIARFARTLPSGQSESCGRAAIGIRCDKLPRVWIPRFEGRSIVFREEDRTHASHANTNSLHAMAAHFIHGSSGEHQSNRASDKLKCLNAIFSESAKIAINFCGLQRHFARQLVQS
jgi:hypothetical protein